MSGIDREPRRRPRESPPRGPDFPHARSSRMSSDVDETNGEPEASPGSAPKGHPKGLYLLFTVEMWERMSYYGMRALLVLYMVAKTTDANPGFEFSRSTALSIYAWYTGLVYLTPVLGG